MHIYSFKDDNPAAIEKVRNPENIKEEDYLEEVNLNIDLNGDMGGKSLTLIASV